MPYLSGNIKVDRFAVTYNLIARRPSFFSPTPSLFSGQSPSSAAPLESAVPRPLGTAHSTALTEKLSSLESAVPKNRGWGVPCGNLPGLASPLSTIDCGLSWGPHSPLACPPWPATVFKFFLFTLLRTLLHSRKFQLFSFQAIAHSLAKTPGGGTLRLAGPLSTINYGL